MKFETPLEVLWFWRISMQIDEWSIILFMIPLDVVAYKLSYLFGF